MIFTIRTPATSANLGPGFDCLGLALDIWATVSVETVNVRRSGPSISRLVEQGVEAAFEGIARPPRLSIDWDGAIPLARGLGGSAALRAAGLLAGNALLDGVHDAEALLAMGTKLEGFPDNMSPCLFGGFQINVRARNAPDLIPAPSDGDSLATSGLIHFSAPLPDDLQVVVFVPDFEMPTQESRRRLPKQLAREEAVFNAGRTALLVAALAASRYDLMDEATQDRIHQPVRSEIFPGLIPIMTAAKEAGAAASYLSGGGSTVAAFVQRRPEAVAQAMVKAAAESGFPGRSMISRATAQGAHIVSTG